MGVSRDLEEELIPIVGKSFGIILTKIMKFINLSKSLTAPEKWKVLKLKRLSKDLFKMMYMLFREGNFINIFIIMLLYF